MAKRLTARFFQVLVLDDRDEVVDLPPLDWDDLFEQWRARSRGDQGWRTRGANYWFEPRVSGTRHLAVHKEMGEDDFLSWIAKGGPATEVQGRTGDGAFGHTSCASFRQGTNVFGIVGGSSAAPRAGVIGDWLQALQPLEAEHSYLVAPIRKPTDQISFDADGAKTLDVTLPVATMSDLGISLGDAFDQARNEMSGVTFSLRLTYGNERADAAGGGAILELAKKLPGFLTKGDRAKVTLFKDVPAKRKKMTKQSTEVVDLIADEIAYKFKLTVKSQEVRIDQTLLAIDTGLGRYWPDIRKALGGNDGDDEELVDQEPGG